MKIAKNLLCTLLVLPLLIFAQKDRTEILNTFNEIKVYDEINVTLIKSSKNKAVITGKKTDDVVLVNRNGRLKVRMEAEDILAGDNTYVTIYYTEDLNLIDANENAVVTVKNPLKANNLVLRAQESASITAKVNTERLMVKAISGGDIEVKGKANMQEVIVRTGGNYDADKLNSETADVTVFAGGEAMVNSNNYVDANVTAGGNIEIFGNPETIQQDKTFGGSIVIHK